ncbi:MAG: hypothetical protein INR62_01415 [Rhodospirillales bacterium]|nr:hypothetical protein [Acetobacter sp.]
MNHGKFWLFLLVNLFLCQEVFPQQDNSVLPSTKPVLGARWTITYERQESEGSQDKSVPNKPSKMLHKRKDAPAEQKPAKSDKVLQSEEYRVTAEAACVTKKYSDGSERAIYIIGGVAYQRSTDGKKIMALSTGGTNDSEITFTEHYPGCDWLQERYYVDTEKQGDRDCQHYRKPANSRTATEGELPIYDAFVTYLDREAWIDAETGLPSSFRQGVLYGTYHHESVLEEPIVVPDEITQAIKRYNGEN